MKKISCWEDLVGLESENYYLDIDLFFLKGRIRPKEHYKNVDNFGFYMTTHSFYHPESTTSILQEYGFDVELISDEE